ncbi:MAG TPA: sucrase ferredoxin, partial [Acidimicrobiales bacterium]|nr:sucrase ferredoxin [Acidimicrobiales bacterium]
GLVASATPERHVICYSAAEGAFRSFSRIEEVVGAGSVTEAALALVAGSAAPAPAPSPGGAPGRQDGGVRDVLVCTHGRRDRCCGSLGTVLADELAAELGAGKGDLPAGVRLWRTSHTGGHRFAPSVIVLPEGTVWGLLDREGLTMVLRRRGPAGEVLGGYRGCSGLPRRELQALEREAIAELGWDVLDAARAGSLEALPEDSWSRASLDLAWDDGRRAAFRAEVGIGRRVPIPDCGLPVEQSFKTEQELSVRLLERTA